MTSSRPILAGLLLVVLTAVAYAPAWHAGFVSDDADYVVDNLRLRSAEGLRDIWLDLRGTAGVYYPLTFTTYWLEYHLWGLDPRGYHVVNVLLHAANAVLAWRILRRLGLPAAWTVAAVFAVHPVHVESVAWVTERRNVLSALLYLLAGLSYLRFRPLAEGTSAPARPWLWYAGTLLAFAAALASKTVTVTLPAALLLLTWWKRPRLSGRDVWPLMPILAMGLAASAVTARLEGSLVEAGGPAWGTLSPFQRVLVAGSGFWFYVGKLLRPIGLSFVYPRWDVAPAPWWMLSAPAAVAAAIVLLWVLRRRTGRGPLVAVLYFAGTLLPTLGLVSFFYLAYSFVADRFGYLPSLGLLALVVEAGRRAVVGLRRSPGAGSTGSGAKPHNARPTVGRAESPARRAVPGMWILAAAVVVVLGAGTFQRCRLYASPDLLYGDALAKDPNSWLANFALGQLAFYQGRLDEAAKYLDAARRLQPGYPGPAAYLAAIFAETGRTEGALGMFAEALAVNPRDFHTRASLGRLYAGLGRLDQAIEQYEESLALAPTFADAARELVETLVARAEQQVAAGDAAKARPLLGRARDVAAELGERRVVEQIESRLREIESPRP